MSRLAIITGGTKGLGREITLAFGRAGYGVLVFYSADEAAAGSLRAELAGEKIEGSVVRHDVTAEDATAWDRAEIREAESLTLIHNACASFAPLPLHQYPWAEFESNFQVAVQGSWRCAQALLRPMLKSGRGTIVNVLTSALAGPAPKGFSAYLTAKHALRGFTLALAAEYSARGVRVFSVSPGFMDTPLTEKWDARLRDAIRENATRITDPKQAALALVKLVEERTSGGKGEDYPI